MARLQKAKESISVFVASLKSLNELVASQKTRRANTGFRTLEPNLHPNGLNNKHNSLKLREAQEY